MDGADMLNQLIIDPGMDVWSAIYNATTHKVEVEMHIIQHGESVTLKNTITDQAGNVISSTTVSADLYNWTWVKR